MKAAKDAGEEYYDPTREVNVKRRNETRLALWEGHLKDPIVALDKALNKVRGSSVLGLTVGSRLLWNRGCNDLRPCGFRSGPRVVGQTFVGKGLSFSGRVGQCASTHSFHAVERPKEVWAAWRASLFFSDLRRSRHVCQTASEAFNSFIGDGIRVPELKGGSEASDGDQAGNVSNEALHVIGLHGSGDKISLSACKDWEMAKGGTKLSQWPWTCCARKCTNWKGDVAVLGSERACRLSDKPL